MGENLAEPLPPGFRVVDAISPPAGATIPAAPLRATLPAIVAPVSISLRLTTELAAQPLPLPLTPAAPVAPPEAPPSAPARKKPASKKPSPAEAIPEIMPPDWGEAYHRARRGAGLHVPGPREMDARWEDFRAYWTSPDREADARKKSDWRLTWINHAKRRGFDEGFDGWREEDERAKRCVNYQIAEEEAARAAQGGLALEGWDQSLLDEHGHLDGEKALFKRAETSPVFRKIIDDIDRMAAESRRAVLDAPDDPPFAEPASRGRR